MTVPPTLAPSSVLADGVAFALNPIDYVLDAYDALYAPLLQAPSPAHMEIRKRIQRKFVADVAQTQLSLDPPTDMNTLMLFAERCFSLAGFLQ